MADVEKKVEDLERIARAAQIAGVRWVSDHAPTDEVLAVEERSSGVSVVAKINPMAEWTDDTALAWVEHIATFDPPTVLTLIERVKVLEEEKARHLFRPGVLRCAKCGFRLISMTLHLGNGAVTARETTEHCPNDGAPMWRVTWEEECRAADVLWEQQVERATAAEEKVKVLEEALAGIADDFMTSEKHHPGYVLIPTTKFEQLREASALSNATGGEGDGSSVAGVQAAPDGATDEREAHWIDGRRFSRAAGDRWRHLKRGTAYTRPFGAAEAMLQTSEPIEDGAVLTIYVGGDGMIFARPTHEFHDGRFAPLPAESGASSPAEGRASPLAQDDPPSTPSVDPGA